MLLSQHIVPAVVEAAELALGRGDGCDLLLALVAGVGFGQLRFELVHDLLPVLLDLLLLLVFVLFLLGLFVRGFCLDLLLFLLLFRLLLFDLWLIL